MPEWDCIDNNMTHTRTAVCSLQMQLHIGADEQFDCQYFCACRKSKRRRCTEFSRGDWTYVGHQYGSAMVNGKCAKILFVAMERPQSSTEPETFKRTQYEFRESCLKRRNHHMGGTDVLLKALLDKTTKSKDRCQQFALTNSVRCRPVADNAKSSSTRTMMRNCQDHTRAIIEALEPNIIVTQGIRFPREQIMNLFALDVPVLKTNNGRERQQRRYAEVYQGKGVIFLLTAHPANHPKFLTSGEEECLPCYLRKATQKVIELYKNG